MKLLRNAMLIIALAAITHAAYCDNAPTAAVQIDGDIPADIRNMVHVINGTLFESIKDDKPDIMMNMFVEEGRDDKKLEEGVRSTYEKLKTLPKGTTFNLLHEYLIDAKGKGSVMLTLPGEGENKFVMSVDAGKGPIYMSILTSAGNFNDIILCFVYLKVKESWRLFTFHCGIYKVAGKLAVQWYDEAKEMYGKGWDVPAMQRMQLMQTFARPAPFIQFDREKEMDDFVRTGIAETSKKYKFPFKAAWVQDAPAVYGLDIQFVKGKLIPVIIYVTKHPMERGALIQDEADAITSKIETLIPGITKTSDEIGYRIFAEPPLDTSKQYKYRSLLSRVR